MRNKFVFICCLSLLLCSCKQDDYQSFLNRQLEKYYTFAYSHYDHIVIIPRTGCHTCIELADIFFEKNKLMKDTLFIFTKLMSQKQLRIELGSESLNLPNVIIDRDDVFFSSNFVDCEYPLILKKSEDGIFYYSFLDTQNVDIE